MYRLPLLLLLLLPLRLGAQTGQSQEIELSFVASDDKSPIAQVICRLYDQEGRLVSHGVSSSAGRVRLSVDRSRVVRMTSSRLGFDKLELRLSELLAQRREPYELRRKVVQLRELVVRPPAIRQRGDTIRYDASAFIQKEDRYAADLLRRMPGVSVSSLGKIEYQGKPISRFYVEGKDLLGSSYDMATRSMPAEAISEVELLEGHQHARILKDKVSSDDAALNIRLKPSYRQRWQGEALLGGGLPAPLGSVKGSLMRFGRSQSLALVEANNAGRALPLSGGFSIADFVNAEVLMLPPMGLLAHEIGSGGGIDQQYYLDNESLRLGLNHLIAPSQEATLKINLAAGLERKRYSSHSRNTYATGSTLVIDEERREQLRRATYAPQLSYEHNAPRLYLNNELSASLSPSSLTRGVRTPERALDEEIGGRPLIVSNLFSGMFSLGGQMFSLKSHLRYYDEQEGLEVRGDERGLEASYRHQIFSAKNFLGSLWRLGSGQLEGGLTGSYHSSRYTTRLDEAHSLAQRDELDLALGLRYIRSWSNGELSLSLPISYTYNALRPSDRDPLLHRLLAPRPSLSIKYNPWYNVKLSGGLGFGRTLDPGGYYASLPLALSYRYRTQARHLLLPSDYWQANLRLEYKIPTQLFFANLSGTYRRSSQDYYIDYDYQASETQARIVEGYNASSRLNLKLQLDKQWLDPRVQLEATASYTQHRSLMSQQGKSFDNLSELLSGSLGGSCTQISWLDVQANLGASLSRHSSRLGVSPLISELWSVVGLVLRPWSQASGALSLRSTISEVAPSSFVGTHLLNASLRYTLSKSLEARLTAMNLLDKRDYEVFTISGPNTSYYRLPLRGREVMLSLSFKL